MPEERRRPGCRGGGAGERRRVPGSLARPSRVLQGGDWRPAQHAVRGEGGRAQLGRRVDRVGAGGGEDRAVRPRPRRRRHRRRLRHDVARRLVERAGEQRRLPQRLQGARVRLGLGD